MRFLFVVRHGDTKANEQGINAGPLDYPMSKKGKKSIEFIAGELSSVKIDRIYASPIFRAQETAKILAKPHKLNAETLQEVTEAKLKPEFVGIKGREHILSDPQAFDETYEQLQSRMVGAVEKIGKVEGNNAILVSHGDPIASLLNYVVERAPGKNYYVLHPDAGSLSIIEYGDNLKLDLMNYHRKLFSVY
jgi:uncharacterized phosphatase